MGCTIPLLAHGFCGLESGGDSLSLSPSLSASLSSSISKVPHGNGVDWFVVFIVCSYVVFSGLKFQYVDLSKCHFYTSNWQFFTAKINVRFQAIGFRRILFLRQSPPLVGEEMPLVAPSPLQLAPLAQLVLPQELQLGAPGEHQQTQ